MTNVAHASADAEATLKKIPIPRLDTLAPDALAAAAAAYAVTVRKVQAADQEIVKIKAAYRERERRLAELQDLLDQTPTEAMHVWCANYREDLSGEVSTMEVPGWWRDTPVLRTTKIHQGKPDEFTIDYYERSWNLAPDGSGFPEHGERVLAEGMTDAQIAYNLAMEPGHHKWMPCWRYGVLLTDGNNNVCNLLLNEHVARSLPEDEDDAMDIDQGRTLMGVPILYPPCNGAVFKTGDEVLVRFVDQDFHQPTVIGFRRNPKKCQPRKTWYPLR